MQEPTRRTFLKSVAATSAIALSARSYARVLGANDRINIAQIGCGDRGRRAHMPGVQQHAVKENIAITAVADPYIKAREEASALCKEWFGEEARQFVSYRDLLALKDIDAVMIASPDHLHTLHLKAAAEAGKHIYVEKPLSMDMESMNAACDAVKAAGVICQVGTQLRSMGSFTGVREFFRSGALGKISRIEQCRNGHRPYWYNYLKDVKEEEVDWQEFLNDRPMRPFRADLYSGWYGYRDFTDGTVPGFGAHYLDLIHYITGASFPRTAVAEGGTFVWKDEHEFTAPDHAQALWNYPEGFMVSYSTNFGNGSGNSFKIFGTEGVLDLLDWNAPVLTKDGVRDSTAKKTDRIPIEPIDRPDHMLNWLQCIRNGETPHAPIDAGYQHAVAALMAVRAFDTGRRQTFDAQQRQILDA